MQPDAKNTRVVSLETFILVLLDCCSYNQLQGQTLFFLEQAEPTDLAFKIYIFWGFLLPDLIVPQ